MAKAKVKMDSLEIWIRENGYEVRVKEGGWGRTFVFESMDSLQDWMNHNIDIFPKEAE